jgi:hypothetical protein
MGDYETYCCLYLKDAVYPQLIGNSFVSVVTAADTPTVPAIVMESPDGVYVNGLVLDGGEYGFTGIYSGQPAPAAMWASTAIDGMRMLNVSLLRGADVYMSESEGYVHQGTNTGGSRLTL